MDMDVGTMDCLPQIWMIGNPARTDAVIYTIESA